MDDDDRVVSVTAGTRLLLSTSPDAKESLEAYVLGQKLRIVDRYGLVVRVEGDRLREKVGATLPPPRWHWLRRERVRADRTIMLTTLPHVGRACVYVALADDGIVLTGGADIVHRIETSNVAKLLGLEDDRVL